MSTIPTPENARQAAIAQREAVQNERDAQLLERRTVLFGNVLLKIEELMETPDVDDVARLQSAYDVLDGKTPTPAPAAPATESLSDDEKELLDVFRKGRIIKTDKGAFRDKEWGPRERAPKAEIDTSTATAPEVKKEEKSSDDKTTKKAETTPIVVSAVREPSRITKMLTQVRKNMSDSGNTSDDSTEKPVAPATS